MAMQKCPVCNGSGVKFNAINYNAQNYNAQCHVCQGCGIIDEKTGMPPFGYYTKTATTTDIKDDNYNNITLTPKQ